MKKNLALFVSIIFCVHLAAQDSIVEKKTFLPTGIYYTTKSLFEKKPDLQKPFELITNYRLTFGNGDTVPYGQTCRLLDSSKIEKEFSCFFDGKDLYINVDEQIRKDKSPLAKGIIHLGKDDGGFFKMDKLGKHSYILVKRGFTVPIVFFTPFTVAANIATASVNSLMAAKAVTNMNDVDVYYFNRKRKLLQATPTGIGFLLKDDKDLYDAYENEPRITTEVMIKYLDKMNERYPDL